MKTVTFIITVSLIIIGIGIALLPFILLLVGALFDGLNFDTY